MSCRQAAEDLVEDPGEDCMNHSSPPTQLPIQLSVVRNPPDNPLCPMTHVRILAARPRGREGAGVGLSRVLL